MQGALQDLHLREEGTRTEHWQLSGVGVQPGGKRWAGSHLQQHVVHLSQKFLVMLIPLNRLFRHLDEMQLWARGLNHLGFPDARPEAWCKGLQLRLSPHPAPPRSPNQPPATHGVHWAGEVGRRVLTWSAASRSAAHSTLGIIRTMKSGLNSTGLIRTSVA